jgi:hypothetical protein
MARWGDRVGAVMGHLAVSKNSTMCISPFGAFFRRTSATLGVYTLHVLALSGRIERESYSLVRNYTRQASVCLQPQPQYVLSRILYPILSIHQKNQPRRNTWRVPTAEVRFLRLCCAYRLVSKHGSRATVHILHRSTSSTTIHFFTYFISIDRPSLMETSVMVSRSWEGRNGTANYGGTNSHTSAEDGEA